jgi:hypothetical protein
MTHIRVRPGGVRSDPDPRTQGWNRDWRPCEHGGASFITETAHVDVVNPQPRGGARIFIGGSRTVSDWRVIANRISQLPRDAIVLTSPTYGACAAVRFAGQDLGLQMEVWAALLDRYPTHEAAYFARDEDMIRSADGAIVFWDGRSSGTAHELNYARRIGKPVDLLDVELPPTAVPYLDDVRTVDHAAKRCQRARGALPDLVQVALRLQRSCDYPELFGVFTPGRLCEATRRGRSASSLPTR